MGKKKNKSKKNNKGTLLQKLNSSNNLAKTVNTSVATKTEVKTETKKETKTETKTVTKTYISSNKSYGVNYNCKGNKNETNYPEFINCKPTQKELKKLLEEKLLNSDYTDVVTGDGYIYAKGTVPVLLTAHMDTVHKEPVKDFYEYYDENKNQHIISSPQGIGGDDRCGIYMILEIIKEHKCSILFCEDEETGGIGGKKFCKTDLINELKDMKYLIELDRKGKNDAVFYDCENDDFTKFIENNTGYKEAYGSFSDISNLSPACKIASVNFSCGYYNAHTTSEYVIIEEMFNTIETVKKLLTIECEQFEYIEKVYSSGNYGYYGYGGYGYNGYNYGYDSDFGYYKSKSKTHSNYYNSYYEGYEDGYDDGYCDALSKSKDVKTTKESSEEKSMLIYVWSYSKGDTISYVSNGRNEAEAFGNFFMKNPTYCYEDIYDYEMSDQKVCNDGWLSY